METKPLDKLQDRNAFDCEVEPLNDYLKKYALQNQKKDAAWTYVLTNEENQIIGYYTLVFGAVSVEEITPEIAAGLGKYPIPIILLARLAIDKNQKGKGFGKLSMKDALLRAVRASEIAGLRAFLVHAKDESAKKFYEKLGFKPSPHNEFYLFLKMSDIRASFADGQ
jgi:GNAT superfamily N-acetyltransferase